MRAGLPVVATDVDGVREAVVDGITGITVPRGNTAELAGSLRRLLIDPELRQSMGAAGRRRYEQHFTQAAMLNHLARIYSSTVVGSEKHVPALQSV
jgi:glycosyltransferase involved in cell wall biosynthesis